MMDVKRVEVVIVENGEKKEYLLLPDKSSTGDWNPTINALGKFVFDQLIEVKDIGEVTVKMGHFFKMEEVGGDVNS